MRPEISSLVRNFLYPDLEDAPQVLEYPECVFHRSLRRVANVLISCFCSYSVKGMTKNVFFVDHRLAEDSASMDHSSKSNTQEVSISRYLFLSLARC